MANGKSSTQKVLDLKSKEPVKLIDAVDFRKNKIGEDEKILVIGNGLSACEIVKECSKKNNVTLAIKHPLKILPLFFFNLNLHWLIRPLELLPRIFFPICKKKTRDPILDNNLEKLIKLKKIQLIKFKEIEHYNYDVIFKAVGYDYDINLLPSNLKKWENGNYKTKRTNESSLENLYLLGYPCSGNLDSVFLRGIYRDSKKIAKILNKKLKTQQ
jgi:hypothetical protein